MDDIVKAALQKWPNVPALPRLARPRCAWRVVSARRRGAGRRAVSAGQGQPGRARQAARVHRSATTTATPPAPGSSRTARSASMSSSRPRRGSGGSTPTVPAAFAISSHTGQAARFEQALTDQHGRLFLATDLRLRAGAQPGYESGRAAGRQRRLAGRRRYLRRTAPPLPVRDQPAGRRRSGRTGLIDGQKKAGIDAGFVAFEGRPLSLDLLDHVADDRLDLGIAGGRSAARRHHTLALDDAGGQAVDAGRQTRRPGGLVVQFRRAGNAGDVAGCADLRVQRRRRGGGCRRRPPAVRPPRPALPPVRPSSSVGRRRRSRRALPPRWRSPPAASARQSWRRSCSPYRRPRGRSRDRCGRRRLAPASHSCPSAPNSAAPRSRPGCAAPRPRRRRASARRRRRRHGRPSTGR